MTGMRKLGFAAAVLVAASGVTVGAAAGDGGPSPGASVGGPGVLGRNGAVRYVALWAGNKTVVAASRTRGGAVLRSGLVPGAYGIPLVAYDGSAGGLSRDGRTLVLTSFTTPPQPGAVTRFAVLSTRTLRPREVVTLRGSYSFDALSPDGSTLYAIEYLQPAGPAARYRVRAVDLVTHRLVAGAIVDRREPDEQMQGAPVTRAESSDGAWAYTLYRKDAGPAFVHALDTTHRTAVCVDLPWTDRKGALWSARMRLVRGGSLLAIDEPGIGRLAVVDTHSFKVRAFRQPVAPGDQSG